VRLRKVATTTRVLILAGVACLIVAGWPQKPAIVRVHPEHMVVEVPQDGEHPWVEIELAHDGMDGYNLHLVTGNYQFTPENIGQEPVWNEGHAHLYINGAKIGRLYSPWQHLSGNLFEPGVNRIHVVLNANDHSVWGLGGEPIGDDVLLDTEAKGDPIVVGTIRYSLTWNWDGVEKTSTGWKVVNDLGYQVEVTSGRLVTRNLELIPCHYKPAQPPQVWLWDLLKPAAVYAGHGSLLPNPAKISRSYEEDFAKLSDIEIESRKVTDPEYCQAHYLIARPTGTGPGDSSLELSGSYAKDGQGEAFTIASNMAYGELKDLDAAVSIVGGIDVVVERSVAKLFDGVDFGAMDERARDMSVLRALVRGASVKVQ